VDTKEDVHMGIGINAQVFQPASGGLK